VSESSFQVILSYFVFANHRSTSLSVGALVSEQFRSDGFHPARLEVVQFLSCGLRSTSPSRLEDGRASARGGLGAVALSALRLDSPKGRK